MNMFGKNEMFGRTFKKIKIVKNFPIFNTIKLRCQNFFI